MITTDTFNIPYNHQYFSTFIHCYFIKNKTIYKDKQPSIFLDRYILFYL